MSEAVIVSLLIRGRIGGVEGEHIDSELLPFVKHFNADYNFLRPVPASVFFY